MLDLPVHHSKNSLGSTLNSSNPFYYKVPRRVSQKLLWNLKTHKLLKTGLGRFKAQKFLAYNKQPLSFPLFGSRGVSALSPLKKSARISKSVDVPPDSLLKPLGNSHFPLNSGKTDFKMPPLRREPDNKVVFSSWKEPPLTPSETPKRTSLGNRALDSFTDKGLEQKSRHKDSFLMDLFSAKKSDKKERFPLINSISKRDKKDTELPFFLKDKKSRLLESGAPSSPKNFGNSQFNADLGKKEWEEKSLIREMKGLVDKLSRLGDHLQLGLTRPWENTRLPGDAVFAASGNGFNTSHSPIQAGVQGGGSVSFFDV